MIFKKRTLQVLNLEFRLCTYLNSSCNFNSPLSLIWSHGNNTFDEHGTFSTFPNLSSHPRISSSNIITSKTERKAVKESLEQAAGNAAVRLLPSRRWKGFAEYFDLHLLSTQHVVEWEPGDLFRSVLRRYVELPIKKDLILSLLYMEQRSWNSFRQELSIIIFNVISCAIYHQ